MMKKMWALVIQKKDDFKKSVSLFKTDFSTIYFYIFLFLYPMMPNYFHVAGHSFGAYLLIGALITFLFSKELRTFSFNPRRLVIFTIIAVLLIVPSALNHEITSNSFLDFFLSRIFVSFYFCVMTNSNKRMEHIFTVLIVQGVILSFFAIFELFGFNIFSLIENYHSSALPDSSTAQRFGFYRPCSCFGQAIAFAMYLSFVIILIFYKLKHIDLKNKVKTVILIGTLLFVNIILFTTLSRMPVFICIISEMFLLFVLKRKTRFLVGVSLASMITTGVILVLIAKPSFFPELINDIVTFIKGTSEDNSVIYRSKLMGIVMDLVGDNHAFGLGRAYNPYIYYMNPENHGYYVLSSYDNFYLARYLRTGLVGMVGSILALAFPIIYISYDSIKERRMDTTSIIFIVLIVSYAVCLFSVNSLDEARLFFILYGVVLSTIKKSNIDHYTLTI